MCRSQIGDDLFVGRRQSLPLIFIVGILCIVSCLMVLQRSIYSSVCHVRYTIKSLKSKLSRCLVSSGPLLSADYLTRMFKYLDRLEIRFLELWTLVTVHCVIRPIIVCVYFLGCFLGKYHNNNNNNNIETSDNDSKENNHTVSNNDVATFTITSV